MNKEYLRQEIERNLRGGFRFAFHYREGGTLSGALTFKFVTTSRITAESTALSTLYSDPLVQVWDLKEELKALDK
jgi:hypothetical protein|tara:strand:+ start:573 stop:797 length:225 start_codon:yes stop_codon:yes gene_type:complete